MKDTIVQEKPDEELNLMASMIIDALESFNIAEKWKVIDSLHSSLLDTIKEEGVLIELKKSS